MKYVLRKGFPGGRNATAAAQIVILLSDGRSQGNVLQAAAELKETGVVLFAVGLRYPRYGGFLPSENNGCNNNAKKLLFLSAVQSLKKSSVFPGGRSYTRWPVNRWRATSSSPNTFTMPSTGCTQHCPPSLSATPRLKVRGSSDGS